MFLPGESGDSEDSSRLGASIRKKRLTTISGGRSFRGEWALEGWGLGSSGLRRSKDESTRKAAFVGPSLVISLEPHLYRVLEPFVLEADAFDFDQPTLLTNPPISTILVEFDPLQARFSNNLRQPVSKQ